eukprot:CAMPEP_0181120872 /NCGR_PEP_ID=MMETSP1071-20121207/24411_1 /TAXON_ID=35127 /ORGANISM="Thalassiosira sp., Strain NH16" /LENGTH=192 /DNA_ID=CAMNT_0023205603 /DNA_START=65 /DNA_END=643 /DNA_ORIENTATION=-
MTDSTPFLPSQMSDTSRTVDKPTPWWKKALKMLLFYIAPLFNIMNFLPYFQGKRCPELEPNFSIISSLILAINFVSAALQVVNNCKLHTFWNPEPLELKKIKETGEMYKGQKAMAITTQIILQLLSLAVGIWAFGYAIQNKDVKDDGECVTFFIFLLITGGVWLGLAALALFGGICFVIRKKVKGNGESFSQ